MTASFFPILQVQPLYGRTFLPDEDRPGVEKVTVLSYTLWQRRFGGDPSIVGRRIRLDRVPSLVVGIMPPSFDFPKGSELWVPLAVNEVEQRQRKNMSIVGILARSSAAATAAQVNLELEALMGVVRNEYPQSPNVRGFAKDFGPVVARVCDAVAGAVDRKRSSGDIGLFGRGRVGAVDCMSDGFQPDARPRNREAAGSRSPDSPRIIASAYCAPAPYGKSARVVVWWR
ncbi:MAG: ABC transporter permease, partial [Verrucomicrobia bacterium]|nr:ABC transporter permease [Verrucomicrobiota bacterium]